MSVKKKSENPSGNTENRARKMTLSSHRLHRSHFAKKHCTIVWHGKVGRKLPSVNIPLHNGIFTLGSFLPLLGRKRLKNWFSSGYLLNRHFLYENRAEGKGVS